MSPTAWKFEIQSNRFIALSKEIGQKIDEVLGATAYSVEREAKLAIQNPPKSGRVYSHGATGIQHQASAPGEAPATDTGTLVRSGATKRISKANWEVSFSTPYAAALEFGTPTIAPRPYLRPAVQKECAGLETTIAFIMKGH